MKAVCWHGKFDVRVENVPDPKILNPRDAIIQVTLTAICGSDLHLYDGVIPSMKKGDILGHEFMGRVVEVGSGVKNLKPGDRVVVPFSIACGNCFFCLRGLWSLCDNSNPNAALAEKTFGYAEAGLFGYSHVYGGYAGGQAEYVRVPFADIGPLKVPDELTDEQVLFLSDILPTGFMAAENCAIQPGDTVAVWGCGPVGQMAIRSAYLLGAHKVIAIDGEPARLRMAEKGHAVAVESDPNIPEILKQLTGGLGPDACIDAVGLEAHRRLHDTRYDQSKADRDVSIDNPHVLRQAIQACRKGGVVSVPGVYTGVLNKFTFGSAFAKGLTFKMGQTHVHRYLRPLLERICKHDIDPSFVITHRLPLEDARNGYGIFSEKEDDCIKVVLKP
jgi:threonine dehydrogenase-like Zn-dependent dehydrogenase